jgi:hypothetical protein
MLRNLPSQHTFNRSSKCVYCNTIYNPPFTAEDYANSDFTKVMCLSCRAKYNLKLEVSIRFNKLFNKDPQFSAIQKKLENDYEDRRFSKAC